MSVLSDMQARLAVPAHMKVNGDKIVRTAASGSQERITGIWNELPSEREYTEKDERAKRIGDLQVDRDQCVLDGDRFTICGESWGLAEREWLGVVSGGLKTIHLQLDDKARTAASRGQIL